ncbi:hypothetical protein [Streptomyces liangshanensis]|uniref:Uncharacterized protein n=1 Tax=Streptomyces liangshanensis TaxID=2717324 RepID=A0A6G9GSD0_9ACTN|nr:hypothetical protein [Streptomyces liangshanensis]QIQ01163.1 hypothetical protein HA039_01580 [Streptomyces liangshanensis]
MSSQDELAAVRKRLDDLIRTVERLERGLAELRDQRSPSPAPSRVPDLIPIPDTPYDSALWTDSDDEGLGASHRRAP